jgi:hypothetical protein
MKGLMGRRMTTANFKGLGMEVQAWASKKLCGVEGIYAFWHAADQVVDPVMHSFATIISFHLSLPFSVILTGA